MSAVVIPLIVYGTVVPLTTSVVVRVIINVSPSLTDA